MYKERDIREVLEKMIEDENTKLSSFKLTKKDVTPPEINKTKLNIRHTNATLLPFTKITCLYNSKF